MTRRHLRIAIDADGRINVLLPGRIGKAAIQVKLDDAAANIYGRHRR